MLVLSCAWGVVEPRNLLRNGDFEEPDLPPPGWTLDASPAGCELSPVALTGRQALKLLLPAPGSSSITSAPCPVAAGETYANTFWYRTDGISGKGTVRCYAYLIWQDGAGNTLRSDMYELPNGPMPQYWSATTAEIAPTGAASVRVKFTASVGRDYAKDDCAFYFDQVRVMHVSAPAVPPGAPTWSYTGRMPSDTLKLVPDADAALGEAVWATAGSSGCLTFGPYTLEQPAGDYLATFRLKVKDNTAHTPVAYLDVTAQGSGGYTLARKTLLASDFAKSGVYQEVSLRFLRPEEGMLEFRVSYLGTTDLWYDRKTITQLAAYPTDQAQTAIWLGEDTGGAPLPPAPDGKKTVLVLAGPDNRLLFPGEALSAALPGPCTYAYLASLQTGFVLDRPLPRTLDALNDVGLVVLANVPAAALNGLMGRRTLRQYVERGGGLLVFGGPLSLGKGGITGSVLEPVLPVATTGPWDLVKAVAPAIKTSKDSPLTRGLRWNPPPQAIYYQRVTPRPGAEVLLTCDGAPILVTGTFGKGRVAVIAATNLGEAAAPLTLFSEWPDYAPLLGRMAQWLCGAER
jgi:uncharacterized membrane protein